MAVKNQKTKAVKFIAAPTLASGIANASKKA
jgi:hypothetical protein